VTSRDDRGAPLRSLRSLLIDHRQRVWAGSEHGLHLVDADSLRAEAVDGLPDPRVVINSLGKNSGYLDNKLKSVSMLGSNEKLSWKQESESLVIELPSELPDWNVIGLRITLK
jgi:hypothetical protein